MNRILVTTDFSANSRAGMRFAIQLASQQEFSLTFFYSSNLTKTQTQDEPVFEPYQKSEFATVKAQLSHFVHSVYKSLRVVPENIDCVVKNSSFPDQNIMNYAMQQGFDFICMSWSGGGLDKNPFGPNTFNLITKSQIPVIAVPNSYRRSKITTILYASDLYHLETELKQVIAFAGPLAARIEILHFNVSSEQVWDEKVIAKTVNRLSKERVVLHMEDPDAGKTFISNLENAIKRSKPSMIIMFRHKNRGFFERFFASGRPAKHLFQAEIPMLVFKKL